MRLSQGYLGVDARLRNMFFGPEHRGERVRIALEQEQLQTDGGLSPQDLVLLLSAEARSAGANSLPDFGLKVVEAWEESTEVEGREMEAPAVLPLLAILVLAVNHGADAYLPHAYYPRLNDLLDGEFAEMNSASLRRAMPLWDALKTWSVDRLEGRQGVFTAGIIGAQQFVGVPRRQVLLAPREVGPLRSALLKVGLGPGQAPSPVRLVNLLRNELRLLQRTRNLLRSWPEGDASRDLVVEIQSAYEEWGEASVEDFVEAGGERLYLKLALIAGPGLQIVGTKYFVHGFVGLADDFVALEGDCPKSTAFISENAPFLAPSGRDGVAELVDRTGASIGLEQLSPFTSIKFIIPGSGLRLYREKVDFLLLEERPESQSLQELKIADLRPGGSYIAASNSAIHDELIDYPIERWVRDSARFNGLDELNHRPFVAGDRPGGGEIEVSNRFNVHGGCRAVSGAHVFLDFALPEVILQAHARTCPQKVKIEGFSSKGNRLFSQTLNTAKLKQFGEGWHCPIPTGGENLGKIELTGLAEDGVAVVSRTILVEEVGNGSEVELPTVDGFGQIHGRREQRMKGLEILEEAPASRKTPSPRPTTEKFSGLPDLGRAGWRHMALMRARGNLAIADAVKMAPACLDPADRSDFTRSRYIHELLALHSLGVVEVTRDIEGKLNQAIAIPPTVYVSATVSQRKGQLLSPVETSPVEFLLAGCWTRAQVKLLLGAVKEINGSLSWEPRNEAAATFIIPRIAVESFGENACKAFSDAMEDAGIRLLGPNPLSYLMRSSLCNLGELTDSEGWLPGDPHRGYSRTVFDPRRLATRDYQPDLEEGVVFVECLGTDSPHWKYFLFDADGERRLHVRDRQLGRWYVRVKALPDLEIPVHGTDSVIFPFELRPPAALERLLVMSSGYLPRTTDFLEDDSFTTTASKRRFGFPSPEGDTPENRKEVIPTTGRYLVYQHTWGNPAWEKTGELNRSAPQLGLGTGRPF